ncbi:hypothetical protein PCANC_15113 [Puccinia coronata f. sp. avenae]|uniref:Uncharacterized protein n=1 Tax=Puccinia coronata f. sp. avenae TaxID=200324 RepID=A0A2N5SQZ6_9BASI|nr:hypothetical protein PCANC_15113 [Puccinia coronata f. sp. avenae]
MRLLSSGWINRLIKLFQKLQPNFLRVLRKLRNCKVKVAPTKTLGSSHGGSETACGCKHQCLGGIGQG